VGVVKIKGSVLRARLSFLAEHASEEGVERVLASMSPDDKAALRGVLATKCPQAFLARAPMIYSFYYDTGRREHRAVGPKEAVLTTYDAETYSAADCLTVVGWHRKALEMCGATGVEVVEEECRARGGNVCRYRLRWA
jgi:uncharacterized protein (TIGR02265 family)